MNIVTIAKALIVICLIVVMTVAVILFYCVAMPIAIVYYSSTKRFKQYLPPTYLKS